MRDNQHLAVVALGPSDTSLISEFARLTSKHSCQITNSHIYQQGEHYSFSFLLSGTWGAIAKIEAALTAMANKSGIALFMQRTTACDASDTSTKPKPAMPYILYVNAEDNAQLLHQITRFLQHEHVDIQEIFIDTYKARYTQLPMLSLTIRALIPTATAVGEWRERFMIFCDELNIDAMMEPEKM